jgi:hypothetical protein
MNGTTEAIPWAHVTLEPGALASGRVCLSSAMEYGFRGPLDIPADTFHPDLQPVARFAREARENGAGEYAEVLLYLCQSTPPGSAQDLLRSQIADVAAEPHHPPEKLEGSAKIVREYHLAKSRFLAACELQRIMLAGEDPADAIRKFAEAEAATAGNSHSMIVAGVNSFPTIVPPETVILGQSWGRGGDVLHLVSGAGGGKSVAANQAAMAWGLGLPYFGIKPPRPLRIMLFSGEDDGVTIGQCREGFLEHSKAITGKQLTAADLEPLDSTMRTEFIREHVGENFHTHLARLLRDQPADLVIVNPLFSYIGGEIVSCISPWHRAGLMPILQEHGCAALVVHHTTRLSKDSWKTIDDTYSGIGGGEAANIPRSVLTLKPTPADGLFVVTVSKRQTTGWKDRSGNYVTSYFVKRSGNPERPAWLPVDHDEAEEMIGEGKAGNAGRSFKKVTDVDVVEALRVGPTQRQALIERVMKNCKCSERTAAPAIRAAEQNGVILSREEINPNGGKAIKWLRLPRHPNQ